MSKPLATDTGTVRVINRLARVPRHSKSPTYFTWKITLPSGAIRTIDLPMGAAVYLEKRGLGIEAA